MSSLFLALTGCSDFGFSRILEDPEAGKPHVHQDSYEQIQPDGMDVVFVIDDSGSMSRFQSVLSANMKKFVEYFLESGLDYHLGVVTTDMFEPTKKGQLQGKSDFPYLTQDTQTTIDAEGLTDEYGYPLEVEDIASDMLLVGIGGSGVERGLDAIYHSWAFYDGAGEANEGFYRDGIDMHAIVVSDEEDQSAVVPANDFIAEALDLEEDKKKDLQVHSIVGGEDPSCNAEVGIDYLAATAALGGLSVSICSSDWSKVMQDLGLQVSGLIQDFTLTYYPYPEAIQVTIEYDDSETGEVLSYEPRVGDTQFDEAEYHTETNSVYFKEVEDIPKPGHRVFIDYEYQVWKGEYEAGDTGDTGDTGT